MSQVDNTPELRNRIEGAIEGLVALLDALDGDENLEETGDNEPWLSTGTQNWSIAGHNIAGETDLEFDYADLGEPDDGI